MTTPLHTRCPQCQTIFHVTPAQLAARAGLVRCGICASAFQADQNLIEPVSNGRDSDPPAPATSRPAPPEPAVTTSPANPDDDLPLMREFPLAPTRPRVPAAVWWVGSVLLLIVLTAQAAYFYAPQLAREPRLKPWLAQFCARAGCRLVPPRETVPIDLAQTSVAPHPDYENALRLQAVLVNRADSPLPWPMMEVSLTDSEGRVLARRRFTPVQYRGTSAPHDPLPPQVTVHAQLDVTNADGRAVGYEIRLLAAVDDRKK